MLERWNERVEVKLPVWQLDSQKGEHGRVLVIGGNCTYYGAPILAALGAEVAGADLITLILPNQHIEAAKRYSLNFFLHSFKQSELNVYDVKPIYDITKGNDVVVIGNGIGKRHDVQKALLSLLSILDIPVIIDAEALIPEIFSIKEIHRQKWILTPHRGEFRRLFGCEANEKNVNDMAQKYSVAICAKGMIDHIATAEGEYQNRTGVPQMRVGGTGDALAGIIAGYCSMGLSFFNAIKSATFLWGKCGEYLFQKRYSLSAYEMILTYKSVVAKMIKKGSQFQETEELQEMITSSNFYN